MNTEAYNNPDKVPHLRNLRATSAEALASTDGFLGIEPQPYAGLAPGTSYLAKVRVDGFDREIKLGRWSEAALAGIVADIGEMVVGRRPRNFDQSDFVAMSPSPMLEGLWTHICDLIAFQIPPELAAPARERPNLFETPELVAKPLPRRCSL